MTMKLVNVSESEFHPLWRQISNGGKIDTRYSHVRGRYVVSKDAVVSNEEGWRKDEVITCKVIRLVQATVTMILVAV